MYYSLIAWNQICKNSLMMEKCVHFHAKMRAFQKSSENSGGLIPVTGGAQHEATSFHIPLHSEYTHTLTD